MHTKFVEEVIKGLSLRSTNGTTEGRGCREAKYRSNRVEYSPIESYNEWSAKTIRRSSKWL